MASHIQPPASIDIEDLESFALHELGHQNLKDNIILGLCQRTDWDWEQARHFLDKVYADNHAELAAQERRLATLLNFILITDGLVVFVIGSLGILWLFFYNPRSGQFLIPSVDYPIVPTVLMALAIAPVYFGFFFIIASIGIGMMAKGILGIIRTIG